MQIMTNPAWCHDMFKDRDCSLENDAKKFELLHQMVHIVLIAVKTGSHRPTSRVKVPSVTPC